MDNMQDMLGSILSDPDAVSKIQELGKSLGLGVDTQKNIRPPASSAPSPSMASDLGALSNLMGASGNKSSSPIPDENTLGMMTKLMPLIQNLGQEDESTALLYALRPFLSGDKRKRIDDAAKLLRVMRLLPMIKGSGIF